MSALVIRLSSLGDVVLAGAVTGSLAPVTFLTSRRYAAVAAALPGVTGVLAWEDGGRLRARDYDRIIDLHASPRSRWLTRWIWPDRVARYDIRRRLRVALKTSPAPPVLQRYSNAASTQPAPLPWVEAEGPGDTLLLFPGAAHATKCWAPARFAEIRHRWISTGGTVLVLGSAAEADLCAEVAGDQGEILAEEGFAGTLQALGRGVAALGADSGLTHLAAAAGIPTWVIFGPTTAQDGFWSHGATPISMPMSCRPCSRHGSASCPWGDHACLDQLSVEQVWAAIAPDGAS